MSPRHRLRTAALAAALVVSACSDPSEPPKPQAVELGGAAPPTAIAGAVLSNLSVVVRDDQGNGMAGQPLIVTVTAGGGTISGAPTTTAAGATPLGNWTLGGRVGVNTLTVTSGSLPVLTISVTSTAGPPADMQVPATLFSAEAGAQLTDRAQVTVVDRFGNGVPAQSVTFRVSAGGGSLTGSSTVISDNSGVAVMPSWVLGKRNVPQQVTVSTGSLTQVINASIRSTFRISLRFFGEVSEEHKAVFRGAADRLSAMITSGAPPVNANAFPVATNCGLTGEAPLTEVIDGIVIYASIRNIDGPGRVLAQAGPCGFRSPANRYQPAVAIMQFDISDLALLTRGGSLEDVATHEMTHTLGFGSLWSLNSLMTGTVNVDPRYIGLNGIDACRLIAPVTCATDVPVENIGGQGTAGGHWRESIFTTELMTGFLNSGAANGFSRMSIASLRDLGYNVSLTAADEFTLPSGLRVQTGTQTQLPENWESVLKMPAPSEMTAFGGVLGRRLQ